MPVALLSSKTLSNYGNFLFDAPRCNLNVISFQLQGTITNHEALVIQCLHASQKPISTPAGTPRGRRTVLAGPAARSKSNGGIRRAWWLSYVLLG